MQAKTLQKGQRAENLINLGLSGPLTVLGCLEKSLHVGEGLLYMNSAH